MASSDPTPPAIGVADSLRPIALESVRARREAPTMRARRPRSRAWSFLWFLGAAVFSFSTMSALERRGLSQLLMPAPPPPAEVVAANEAPTAFTMTRHARTFDERLASPWRHRERDESKAPAGNATRSTSIATTTSVATSTSVASTSLAAASPPVARPKKDAKPTTARVAASSVTAAKPAESGADEAAAAAEILEKARGERSLD